jgi:hypothetical protein
VPDTRIDITEDTTPRELAEALIEALDPDDLADLVRLLRAHLER